MMSVIRTKNGAVIEDRRSSSEVAATTYFVVAQDPTLSGWGCAPHKSYFAIPVSDAEDLAFTLEHVAATGRFIDIALVDSGRLSEMLSKGDHLHITNLGTYPKEQ